MMLQSRDCAGGYLEVLSGGDHREKAAGRNEGKTSERLEPEDLIDQGLGSCQSS